MPDRWRKEYLIPHLCFDPTARQLQYLAAYRHLLSSRQRPTLARLASLLGISRQTVWQLERKPEFRTWLVAELDLWRKGYGTIVEGAHFPPQRHGHHSQ